MNIALLVLGLVATVVAVSAVCRRLGLPTPLVLVLVGIVWSYIPFIPNVRITPDLVLLGFLPPLLYAAAIRTSLVDIKANRRSIGLLAVGLVLFTTAGVGLLAYWLLPVPLAAALAFGAVVAPPDAVAATSIARKIGLPRRIVTILEGESLLNDATALVALRTAIAALTATVTVASVGLDFLVAAGGGAVIGLVVAIAISFLRKRLTDTVSDTSISFMAPFVAYLPAEEVHASGVIAVVVAGLILGHKAPIIQDAPSRLSERINWTTIQFLLENTVFLLLGIQLSDILDDVSRSDLPTSTIVWFCIAALAGVILLRPIWVFSVSYLLVRRRDTSERAPWTNFAVTSWAGMRGVVTIAAVFLLPEATPHREILVLGAFVVTAGTLLLQGLTLPWVARLLGVRGPNRREDVLQEASVLQSAMAAGFAELDRVRRPTDDDAVLASLRERGEMRANRVWERLGKGNAELETPSEQYRRLRMSMLNAERAEVLRIRNEGVVDHEVLADVMASLDLEESILDVVEARDDELEQADLLAPAQAAGACEHLEAAHAMIRPLTPQGCPDCVLEGTTPVHLRMCLGCGYVGCCDSSVGRHSERHFTTTRHPVMRSFEPGEAWRWCYVDATLG